MVFVELVYAEHCPNVGDAREQLLRAFAQVGLPARWTEWQADAHDTPEHLRAYGSPTILVDGLDVAAVEPPGFDACRVYPSVSGGLFGVPSVESIVAALCSAGASSARGRLHWPLNLAALPGVGAALLPKVACPACWPAYAGFISSAGLGFLLDSTYLLPLTATFLAVAVAALAYRASERRGYGPFALGLVAAVSVLIGKFVLESDAAMYSSLVVLVGASIWNTWPKRRSDVPCRACSAATPNSIHETHGEEK